MIASLSLAIGMTARAAAEPPAHLVRITTGAHPGFGRLVLEIGRLDYSLQRDADRVAITFSGDVTFRTPAANPPDVVGLAVRANGLDVTVAPRSIVHDRRQGTKLVIDVDDPSPAAVSASTSAWGEDMGPNPATPAETLTAQPKQEEAPVPPVTDDRTAETPNVTTDRPGPLVVAQIPTGPIALIATKAPPPAGLNAPTIQIPFAGGTGAAMFSRGPDTWIIFDERKPVDLSMLRDDPVFSKADVILQPSATVLHLTIPPGQGPSLTRTAGGWRVSVGSSQATADALAPAVVEKALEIPANAPGQVVAITDPHDGTTLLAGTQRKPGQAIRVERRTAEFILPVTDQGVVVSPLSSAIGLNVAKTGFVLTNARDGLALSPAAPMAEAAMEAARLTRAFEFPAQSTEALAWRARRLAYDAATTPPLNRGPRRMALAECLIALGMGVEARTVLRVAAKDDPALAATREFGDLMTIANLLSYRPSEASGLAEQGTDETTLWRGIRMAMTEEASPAAATILAPTAALLFTYPEELRRRFLPLAMETLVAGGQTAAAAHLLSQRPTDPGLAFARAALRQATGDNEGALKAFDTLVQSRSPLDHARAATRAVELRLAMGKIDEKAAAEALEKHLYAWRGDAQDLKSRERIAALDQSAGAWRAVFSILRGARQDFPAETPEIDRRIQDAFTALPRDPSIDRMSPTELIGLLEENAELLGVGPEGEPMRERLAEKLLALDLPKRADPVLTSLMRNLPPGPSRAGFGATLATLRLREGDGDGALVALSESSSDAMPADIRESRALIAAKVEAKRGHVQPALEALSGLDTKESDEIRASLLESNRNWPAAVEALKILVARQVPATGRLDDSSTKTVLRLASAATQAKDESTLAMLRQAYSARVPTGASGDLLRLLTEAPVRGTDDLARARAEIGLARAVTTTREPSSGSGRAP